MDFKDHKIAQLQLDNRKLSDEIKTLSKKYEELCFKLKEERNLIKRLEDELGHSNNKNEKDEMEKTIQAFKDKIEQLSSSLSTLECKYRNSSQNCIKYQENEVKYNALIKKYEAKLQFKENKQINARRAKDDESNLLLIENTRLNEMNSQLKNKIDEMNKMVNETNLAHDQLKKENEMIYRILEDSRSKMKKNQDMMEELSQLIKEKQNSEMKYQKLIVEKNIFINDLKSQIDSLKSSTSTNINAINIFDNIEVSTNDNINIISNKVSLNEEHIIIKAFIESNISLIENKIKVKLDQIEQRHLNQLTKLKSSINTSNKQYTISLLNYKKKLDQLKTEVCQLKDLIHKSNEKQKNSVDLSEIRNLFNKINQIIQRLKLTMETFSLNLKCKNCFQEKNKFLQLKCGHSICADCLGNIKECVECFNKQLSTSDLKENMSYNGIIARYKYAQQQIESDIELVISSLKDYLIE